MEAVTSCQEPLSNENVRALKDTPEMACIWPWRFPNVFINTISALISSFAIHHL